MQHTDDETGLPHHIPDEMVAAWSKKTDDELMKMLTRLKEHIATISIEEQANHMRKVERDLERYVEKRLKNSDIDLDVFIQTK